MVLITNEQREIEYQNILNLCREKIPILRSKKEIFEFVIQKLSNLPHFHWTGIYEYDTPKETLKLFPVYVGLSTDHITIPKGKGVCGTAVAKNEDVIVDDVTQLDNYLACSSQTRSEIVVLIKNDNEVFGQIDVDSDEVGSFNKVDQKYLDEIAKILAAKIEILKKKP